MYDLDVFQLEPAAQDRLSQHAKQVTYAIVHKLVKLMK